MGASSFCLQRGQACPITEGPGPCPFPRPSGFGCLGAKDAGEQTRPHTRTPAPRPSPQPAYGCGSLHLGTRSVSLGHSGLTLPLGRAMVGVGENVRSGVTEESQCSYYTKNQKLMIKEKTSNQRGGGEIMRNSQNWMTPCLWGRSLQQHLDAGLSPGAAAGLTPAALQLPGGGCETQSTISKKFHGGTQGFGRMAPCPQVGPRECPRSPAVAQPRACLGAGTPECVGRRNSRASGGGRLPPLYCPNTISRLLSQRIKIYNKKM